jgi:hypothetical protein
MLTTVIAVSAQQDGFERFVANWPNTDFSQASISADEIFPESRIEHSPPYYPAGYVYPDDVPFLGGERPRVTLEFTSIEATNDYLPDEQQVIAVEHNGEAQAYPLVLLNNHEIANADIGGVPILVTFCPLCNASIVYDRRIDGTVRHFGVSGLLRNSDLIMWDHETQSWWQQFTGEAIVGEMTGTQLEQIPSLVVSWGEFKAEFPEGRVLRSLRPDPTRNVSYGGYDLNGNAFLYFGERDTRLGTTERVLGYFGPQGAIAYPFLRLAEFVVVNDRIGGDPVVVLWQRGSVSLFTNSIETGSAGLYSAVLDDGTELTFSAEEGVITDDETGSVWNVFGRATEGELEDTQLEQQFAYPHFWFAWAAFRPDTLIWELDMVADEAWAN